MDTIKYVCGDCNRTFDDEELAKGHVRETMETQRYGHIYNEEHSSPQEYEVIVKVKFRVFAKSEYEAENNINNITIGEAEESGVLDIRRVEA